MTNIEKLSEQVLWSNKTDPDIEAILFEKNRAFAIYMARKLYKTYNNCGFTLDDIIAISYEALLKAIRGFNNNNGNTFSTFAGKCIINKVYTYITRKTDVKKTHNTLKESLEISAFKHEYFKEHGRKPTPKEVMFYVGTTKDKNYENDVTIEYYNELKIDDEENYLCDDRLSFNYRTSNEPYFIDTIDEEINKEQLLEYIIPEIKSLPERQSGIIFSKVGLTGKEYTYEDLSSKYNISKQRVHQIFERGIKKIRTRVTGKYYKSIKSCGV